MRDHGGNLDQAVAAHGGRRTDWLDLSTGINRLPYPVPALAPEAWTDLPHAQDLADLKRTAQIRYGTEADVLALPGAQAAIQLIPHLARPGDARILSPTYNEHAAWLRAAGWQVREVATLDHLRGADLAVVVNPNNPDGRRFPPADLSFLATKCGRLIVDESFADPVPGLSLGPDLPHLRNTLVLRSFGKFYGLAGLRLGFVLGHGDALAPLSALAGPWPVSGPALAIGQKALSDGDWAQATTARLTADADRLDALALSAGWTLVGGTPLFRLYDTPDAEAAQSRLARHHIWSRIFPWSPTLLRLGLPGPAPEWTRLAQALAP